MILQDHYTLNLTEQYFIANNKLTVKSYTNDKNVMFQVWKQKTVRVR